VVCVAAKAYTKHCFPPLHEVYRPPFPPALYARFKKLAERLGYTANGTKWWLLEKLLDRAEREVDQFKRT